MRSQILLIAAVLGWIGGQAICASEEQGIKLTSLSAMERIA